MPVSGKIYRGASGRLARDSSGRLRRCSCCIQGGGCIYVIKALPCRQVLDGNCERQLPEFIWICTSADCDGEPVGTTEVKHLAIALPSPFPAGPWCYYTVPGSQILRTDVPPEEESFVFGGGICADGCDDPVCADPEEDYCSCVCHAIEYDETPAPIGSTFCCLGKKDADGNMCWDWTLEAYEEWRREYFPLRGGIAEPCNTSDEYECNLGPGSCVTFRREWRHKNPNPYDLCQETCCRTKALETRMVINKVRGPGDQCAIYPGFCQVPGAPETCPCCVCPNSADGVWEDAGTSRQECVPTNHGTTTTVTQILPPSDNTGCDGQQKITVVTTQTCDYRETTTTEELYEYAYEFNPECSPPGSACCVCQVKTTVTTYERVTFIRPRAGDPECSQCKASILAA